MFNAHPSEFGPFGDPQAVAILRRIRAMGYEVRGRRHAAASSGEPNWEACAGDDRTGERHTSTADGSDPEAEVACARALADLVAGEMEG